MANTEGMKIKFTVIKNTELDKLSDVDKFNVVVAESHILTNRLEEGKDPSPSYLVINTDEEYADEIISILKRNGHWG